MDMGPVDPASWLVVMDVEALYTMGWEDSPIRLVHRHKKLMMGCIGLKSVHQLQVGIIAMHHF